MSLELLRSELKARGCDDLVPHVDRLAAALDQARAERDDLRDALEQIAEQQPVVLAYIERNGFVFEDIGREPGNWQHLAFSIYTDLCQVDSVARSALDALAGGTEPEGGDMSGNYPFTGGTLTERDRP